jgi:muconolactone delta-isomerase
MRRDGRLPMEYLVTMTTHVPDGVPASEVDTVRAREAAHTRELARQGRLLRLWRPPLRPTEWRTLGLFDAEGEADLEEVLASMPLRVWRTDAVTPLAPHSNDPGRGQVPVDSAASEFLTTFTVKVPSGTGVDAEAAVEAGEARRTAELAGDGHLIRLWRLPGEGRNLGHWQAGDADQMADLLRSLPMFAWLDIDTVALTRHPSDPEIAAADN